MRTTKKEIYAVVNAYETALALRPEQGRLVIHHAPTYGGWTVRIQAPQGQGTWESDSPLGPYHYSATDFVRLLRFATASIYLSKGVH